ncbi:type IVB secretion system protein IcmH/DotU [Alcaligenes sp. SDU_A2]|uniref:type IVB secretion system protein IcmH/DotU n=1 Tax=Alcaligenes sp. SDU_A2 TaxID=3136634 RepID=UPI00311F0835
MTTAVSPPPDLVTVSDAVAKPTLVDLFYEGFLMLFLLKNGSEPISAADYTRRVQDYLADVDRQARAMNIAGQDCHAAKYAFCATVDEIILQSDFAVKQEWYIRPLQLTLFGDQLAGANFFERLEELRLEGAARLPSLEVFHMCLLLGFQGKYVFEGQEKLGFLTSKLGDEIARMRNKRSGFAPFWAIPDKISHTLKRDMPLWAMAALVSLCAVAGFLGIRYALAQDTHDMLGQYQHIVSVGPRSAHLTITLP